MSYIDGFLLAVPKENKEAYLKLADMMATIFRDHGATRVVECWGDDVPHGKLNDFYTAVHAKDDEIVVFSWIEYPSKAVRDAANEKMMSDPRMKEMTGEMPFDSQRMMFGGFSLILDER